MTRLRHRTRRAAEWTCEAALRQSGPVQRALRVAYTRSKEHAAPRAPCASSVRLHGPIMNREGTERTAQLLPPATDLRATLRGGLGCLDAGAKTGLTKVARVEWPQAESPRRGNDHPGTRVRSKPHDKRTVSGFPLATAARLMSVRASPLRNLA